MTHIHRGGFSEVTKGENKAGKPLPRSGLRGRWFDELYNAVEVRNSQSQTTKKPGHLSDRVDYCVNSE